MIQYGKLQEYKKKILVQIGHNVEDLIGYSNLQYRLEFICKI